MTMKTSFGNVPSKGPSKGLSTGRLVTTAVGLAAAGLVLTSCGGSGTVVSVQTPAGASPTASATTEPAVTGPRGAAPKLPPAPNLPSAQARVQSALSDIKLAAARVSATAATPRLQRLANVMNGHLSQVVHYRDVAIAAGLRGDCRGSFAASRASDKAYNDVKRDVNAIRREIAATGHVKASFNEARANADRSLQVLFNAIAGNPLEAGRSTTVDELRTAIAAGAQDARDAADQVHTMLQDANAIRVQAKNVAIDAAYAACAEVARGSN